MNLTDDFGCEWCVLPADMDESVVGSKSLNLTRLTNLSDVRFPQALALPFGCFQKTLACRANRFGLQKVLQDLQPTTSNTEAKDIFKRAQICIRRLDMPPELAQALEFILKFGNVGPNDLFKLYKEDDAWDAIRRVLGNKRRNSTVNWCQSVVRLLLATIQVAPSYLQRGAAQSQR